MNDNGQLVSPRPLKIFSLSLTVKNFAVCEDEYHALQQVIEAIKILGLPAAAGVDYEMTIRRIINQTEDIL